MEEPLLIRDILSTDEFEQSAREQTEIATSIDVLDIVSQSSDPSPSPPSPYWQQGLTHEQLLERFGADAPPRRDFGPRSLLILFLNPLSSRQILNAPDYITHNFISRRRSAKPKISPKTLRWLHARFEVSLLFLHHIVDVKLGARPGNARFTSGSRQQSLAASSLSSQTTEDLMYFFVSDPLLCAVWKSQRGSETVYVIRNCQPRGMQHMVELAAHGLLRERLLQPYTVDSIVAETALQRVRANIKATRHELAKMEQLTSNRRDLASLENAFEDLYSLSQRWNVMHEELVDSQETLEFLLDCKPSPQDADEGDREYMSYMASRNRMWSRWVANYATRTRICMDLFYNAASERDSRTNIGIAAASRRIAADTHRDSSSMITIAALTMLFLPGTFVSTIFSMTFFNVVTNDEGTAVLSVAPQWWYFLAGTVPLTVLVFGSWIFWQWRRERKVGVHLEQSLPHEFGREKLD